MGKQIVSRVWGGGACNRFLIKKKKKTTGGKSQYLLSIVRFPAEAPNSDGLRLVCSGS